MLSFIPLHPNRASRSACVVFSHESSAVTKCSRCICAVNVKWAYVRKINCVRHASNLHELNCAIDELINKHIPPAPLSDAYGDVPLRVSPSQVGIFDNDKLAISYQVGYESHGMQR